MINWKLRFKNKTTLLAIASTVILLAQQLGFKLPDNIADIVNTFFTLLVLVGVINDPTTEGISDSPKALTYSEPKKEQVDKMKKNDYFIDVSSYQSADLTAICQAAGTRKTVIKVSEGTGYLSPNRFKQAETSEPVGFYHFARFGGNVSQAVAEANYFLANIPTKVPYLVCDYEDGASTSKQANTNAVLAFMDKVASAGYKPIYYSYKPYTLTNVDYQQILAKYPNSLWIAAYPNYNVTPDPVWSIFPSMDGIRWWQFTSTGIAGGLDKNVVLLDDEQAASSTEKQEETEKTEEEEDMLNFVMRSKTGKQGYVGCVNGAVFGIGDIGTVKALQEAGCKHLMIDDADFDRLLNSQKIDDEKRNEVLKVALENVANTIKNK